MKLYTTDFISGKEIETLQMVKGSVVFSKNVVRDLFAGIKTLVGGEIAGYTEMLNDARRIATALGADAIVAVRFMTSSVMAGASEIIVYGTAVKVK
ncbi:MAG: YbjQ family protein [Fibrobacter sp.]|nr:YbjQ family protein [Fibrobacter sp.]